MFSILSSTAILFGLTTTPFIADANNEDVTGLEEEKNELDKKSNNISGDIDEAEEKMNSLDAERQKLMDEITNIQESISDLIVNIDEKETELNRLEKEINKLNEEIELLEEQIEERNKVLADQARGLQTGGSPENLIDLMLSSDNLTDLIGKIEVVNLVVKNNNTIMEEQEKDQNQVKKNKENINLSKEKVIDVKEELEKNRANLENQEESLEQNMAIVSEKYSLTASEKETMQANQQKINEESNQLKNKIQSEKEKIAAEKARKKAEEEKRLAMAKAKEEKEAAAIKNSDKVNKNVGTSSSKKDNSGTKPDIKPETKPEATPNKKGWARPASGPVTSEYGYRIHPIYGTKKLHAGTDIGGGGTITAAKAGTVTVAQKHPSWGNYVKIDHGNGVSSLYAHMKPGLKVSAGQSVSQGQALGIMGTTGSSTGIHLHFEVYEGFRTVNPRNYVNF